MAAIVHKGYRRPFKVSEASTWGLSLGTGRANGNIKNVNLSWTQS